MKILVTGRAIPNQPDRSTGQQLVRGFEEAGHEATFYGCFYGQPHNFLGFKELQESSGYDLVIFTEMNDGMSGYQTLLQYHKLKDTPKLYWDFDVSYHRNVSIQRARSYNPDGYLIGNKYFFGPDGFGALNKPMLHLPYACSPTIHRRKPEVYKNSTVGFIGSITPERKPLLESVRCISGVFGEDLINATNELYVMVHINQDACAGLVPGRPWETAGCGTCLLMDRASYDDFMDFIPEDVADAVMCFESQEDFHRIIKEWEFCSSEQLLNLRKRGEKLMKHVHENHSYKNRAQEIIEWSKQAKIL